MNKLSNFRRFHSFVKLKEKEEIINERNPFIPLNSNCSAIRNRPFKGHYVKQFFSMFFSNHSKLQSMQFSTHTEKTNMEKNLFFNIFSCRQPFVAATKRICCQRIRGIDHFLCVLYLCLYASIRNSFL